MNILTKNKQIIASDIRIIKDALKSQIVQIGLFGSMLEKPISKTKDIDLVIYCNEDYEIVKSNLLKLELEFPICPHKMNGTYGIKEYETLEKHYHIILLNSDHPNEEFESINKGKIIFL